MEKTGLINQSRQEMVERPIDPTYLVRAIIEKPKISNILTER